VVGVAPGVPLYAVRVLNNAGSGTRSDMICGIDWVTGHASTVTPKIVAAKMYE
jgi:subtilisin